MGVLKTRAAALARTTAKSAKLSIPDDIYALMGFAPRDFQADILAEDRRFNVRVIHRRAGKTVMEIAKLIERAIENPLADPRYAYCGPTYGQVKDIAWSYLQAFHDNICRSLGLKTDDWKSASDLSIYLPTRSGHRARIRLYGLDSPKQRVRGLYLDGLVLDEWAWIAPSAWTEQLRAMLADQNRACVDHKGRRNQWADFIFTPFGRNHAYHMFVKADLWHRGLAVTETDPQTGRQSTYTSDEWTATLRPASVTGVLDEKELADLKADIGIAKYEQEFECSFDAAVVGAVYARDLQEARQQGRVGSVPWIKQLPVHTAWDLGFSDATSIVFFQQVGRAVNIIDFYEARLTDLEHFVDVLADKGYRYGRMLFPHDVEQQHLAAGGKSMKQQLSDMGVRVTTLKKHRIRDRIGAVQASLSRCWFDERKCRDLLDRLALYRFEYDDKRDIMSAEPVHDWTSHAADAFGYAIVGAKKHGDDKQENNDHVAVV